MRFINLIFASFAAVCMMLASCSEGYPDLKNDAVQEPENQTSKVKKIKLDKIIYEETSSIEGCSSIWAASSGKMADDYAALSIHFLKEDISKKNPELTIKDLSFGFPYSSDSRNYGTKYSGRIYLKSVSKDKMVIGMDKVTFDLAFGKCVIDDDIVCKF